MFRAQNSGGMHRYPESGNYGLISRIAIYCDSLRSRKKVPGYVDSRSALTTSISASLQFLVNQAAEPSGRFACKEFIANLCEAGKEF